MKREVLPKHSKELIPGFAVFQNSDNRIAIVLNYVAMTTESLDIEATNIERRKEELPDIETTEEYYGWLAESLGGKESPLWQEEMENSFDAAHRKLAAYYNFEFANHTSHYPGKLRGALVHASIDFGWHHPCVVVGQTETMSGPMRIHLHEVIRGHQVELETFLDVIKQHIKLEYPDCDVKWYCTQEGDQHGAGGQTRRTPREDMAKAGIAAIARWHHIEDGVDVINKALARSHKIKPIVTVNPACDDFIDMFAGGYRRETITRFGNPIPTAKYIKDGLHDHVSDALRPIFYTLFKEDERYKKKISRRGGLNIPI